MLLGSLHIPKSSWKIMGSWKIENVSVLLLIMGFVIALSKWLWIHEAIVEWIRRLLGRCCDEVHCR